MALQANALTTVANVQAAGSSVASARLEILIGALSDAIENELGRSLGYGAQVENLPGNGRFEIFLRRWPVAAVSGITIQGAAVTDYTLNATEGSLYRLSGWPLVVGGYPDLTQDPDLNLKTYPIAVTYTGGYILPQYGGVVNATYNPTGAATSLPAILQEACIQGVISYSSRPGGGNLIMEKTPGGHQQAWARPSDGRVFLNPGILEMIGPYRARWVA